MDPRDLLPHREPFLLVDDITSITPGERATGTWHLSGAEPFFAGHFPGRPTLPGVLMVESLAQVGACAVLADERYAGRLPLFGGIDTARFRAQVGPGDTLELSVEMSKLSARGGKGSGVAIVQATGKKACEAAIFFVIG